MIITIHGDDQQVSTAPASSSTCHKSSGLPSFLFGRKITMSSEAACCCRFCCCFRFTSRSFDLLRSSFEVLREDGFELALEFAFELALDELLLPSRRGDGFSSSFCFFGGRKIKCISNWQLWLTIG